MKAGTQNITFIFNIYMQIESTKFGTQRFFFAIEIFRFCCLLLRRVSNGNKDEPRHNQQQTARLRQSFE